MRNIKIGIKKYFLLLKLICGGIIRSVYMFLCVRPQQLVKLVFHPEFYTSPTYYPEYPERLRSHWSQFWNQVGEILRFGRINTLYYLCGYDVKTREEQKKYVHYNTFMRRREKLNMSVEDNCACILRDKLYFSVFTEGIGLKEPNTLFYTLNGELYDFRTKAKTTADAILALGDCQLFCKPLDGQCGRGIFLLQVKEGKMVVIEKEVHKNDPIKTIEKEMDAKGLKEYCSGGRYLIQAFVKQHPAMSGLHPQSVNTIRLLTVRSLKDGQIHVMPSILRIGTGDSIVDNTSQGGLAVGIDIETGYLKQYGFYKPDFGYDVEENGVVTARFKENEHPDSHIRFADFQIPYFQEVLRQAKYYHEMMPSLHSIGWDIAIGEDGPIFIEGNDNWEITGPQTCNGGLRKEFEEYFVE